MTPEDPVPPQASSEPQDPAQDQDQPLVGQRVGIVGAGAVGTALCAALVRAGASVELWSRTDARAAAAAASTGARRVETLSALVFDRGATQALLLLAVPELALADLASELAGLRPGGGVALHTAGAIGPEALAPLRAAGWNTGQLHPLVAVPRGGDLPRESWWGVAGDERARAAAAALLLGLGGRALELAEGGAARYHLGANLVAGGAAVLVDLGLRALEGLADPGDARRALAALLSTAARNLADAPPEQVLTGPQARGSEDVVAAHLAAAEAHDPALAVQYRQLALAMVALAERGGKADPARLARLVALLERA